MSPPVLPAPKSALRVMAALRKALARLALYPALFLAACLAAPGLLLLAIAAGIWLMADTLAKRLEQ